MTTSQDPADAFALRGELDQTIYDDFCQRVSYRFGGVEYLLGDSDLGEPFVLIRKSDGARFEVELGAEVRAIPEPAYEPDTNGPNWGVR